MKLGSRILLIIFGIFILLIVLARNSDKLFPNLETEYSSNFSLEKFESIRLDMSKKQVDSILGKPFSFNKTEFIFNNKIDSLNNQFIYYANYSKEKKVSFIFGGFWHFYVVHFDNDTLVIGKDFGTEYD